MAHCASSRLSADGMQDGSIDRAEFLRYMLVAHGLVEELEIAKLDTLFDSLDVDGSGSLDAADMRRGSSSGGGNSPGTPGGGGFVNSFELRELSKESCSEGSEAADEVAPLNAAANRSMQPMARRQPGPRNV